ncbi:ABC transporter ATP-binding protein [Fodinibacter luteus]|uniref:ABC transporter ATP-binding protein n=1 Tax=Fodinibacter luteus TaxID=552064 RepID=A0ABP8KLL9_9MICO
MSAPAIEVHQLTKSFGATTALDHFDLVVQPGEVTGFLGPNGAGKTTTIRILLGLIRADGGTARVLGKDPWQDAVELHPRLAYVPGDVALWPSLTGGETLDLLARMHGRVDTARRDRLVERFELDPAKKVRAYSTGNRQKVALVAALSTDAELFLLDEPTAGLDPLMEAAFRDEVAALRTRGVTVLLSSHILGEVERLCDTVTIIRDGRAVEAGNLAELRHLTRSTVTLRTRCDLRRPGGLACLAAVPGIHDLSVDGDLVTFEADAEHIRDLVSALTWLDITDITWERASLEDLFLRHYTTVGGTAPR